MSGHTSICEVPLVNLEVDTNFSVGNIAPRIGAPSTIWKSMDAMLDMVFFCHANKAGLSIIAKK